MDRNNELLRLAQPLVLPAPGIAARALKVTSSVVPWLIIGGLLWAGLFVKPAAVGSTVQPPVLETRDRMFGVAAPGDGRVWLAGSGGKIVAVAPDGGLSLLASGTDRTLQDVAAWDARHGIAVGNDGVIVTTADGGRTWSAASDVPRSEVANKLTRVRVAEGGRAVVVGEMGAILASDDFGASWRRLRDEEDVAWNDVALLDARELRVVGEFGRMLVSHDSGASWREAKAPVETSLMAVAFRDARHGVAVGLDGVVVTTEDGGDSWRLAETGIHDHLLDIAWDASGARWIGAGVLGRWVSAPEDAKVWSTGRVDEHDLSWHTRVLPAGGELWFAGAGVGRWDGSRWQPLVK
ncbi:MAG TPA: YCF48-related protein [Aromatoleum sp.]|uniref:WD40/YVTN/BNR-like repeat-containing protein n=1 Tax=Aromatoleum sp. TaxID=2307007 RepID=UPI002B465DE4|nr:YCF48-related protein [Aromatoleum sp.]HJV25970.1 YCF48-related protein [Aromatoleum sp.]